MKVPIHEIASFSKGTQINGSDLIPNGKYDFLNGGIHPSGKWSDYNVQGGTVTVSEGGNSCGYVNYMTNPFWCGAHCYYFYDLKVPSKYLYYALKSQQDSIMRLRSGSCMPNIKMNALSEFEIPVTFQRDVQENIVANLDKVSALIDLRKRQLAKLDELVKAQFIACFTLDCKYPVVPIGELVDKNIGRKKALFGKYDTIRYIDISSIDNRQRKITGFVEYPINDAPSRAQQLLKKDDILVSTVRPNLQNIARNPYSDGNVIASTGFCVLRCSKCLPEYLLGVVSSEKFTSAMSKQAKGANYPAVGNNDILQYRVPNAPLNEQERFAAFVREIEKLRLTIRQGFDKMEALERALMQEYFGG